MTIWFTGCTHYGHEKIISLASRPFSSLEHMDETLIANHNSRVQSHDLVFFLGDFAWRNNATYLQRLKGCKTFVFGNHDSRHPDNPMFAHETHEYLDFQLSDYLPNPPVQSLALFHYPIEDWNGRYKGSIHLHCHTHEHVFRRPHLPQLQESSLRKPDETAEQTRPHGLPEGLVCNRFNITVEACNYAPVSLDYILGQAFTEE